MDDYLEKARDAWESSRKAQTDDAQEFALQSIAAALIGILEEMQNERRVELLPSQRKRPPHSLDSDRMWK
jgi:hypothetical protein